MFRRVAFAVFSAGLLATSACAPITTYSGFQAIDASPTDVKVGEDTKSTVRGRLGSPSATSTFEDNIWFYVAQVKEQVAFLRPQIVNREVVAITFNSDSEVVESVDHYTLEDGRVVAFNDRETPTRGRELTVLEQLLGNVGRGGMLPRDDESVPGNRPGDRR
ncbi:MAG: outer membrane protein assembly factor BamE [Phenylobacterium sp.]|uniref:outer membrane protein assembly factor BamE n=1 Tax=Phenylobacterium sp. TaxID=1871053 RepID=UPI002719052A|nr:outer membrane protein assembly factor BamE [Phenylobacterium sp.]MDO8900913.1 outer membrane protein assembly factor BamE [Phenylobacterium sp.]MDP2212666.1 outer membrane protein assembly factor BamE [Phenylobacterium sp.]